MTRFALVIGALMVACPSRAERGDAGAIAGELGGACASYAGTRAMVACRLSSPAAYGAASALVRELGDSGLLERLDGAIEILKKALPGKRSLKERLEAHRHTVDDYRRRRNRIRDRYFMGRPMPVDVEAELSSLTKRLRSLKWDLGAAEKEVAAIRERSDELDRLGRELRGLAIGLGNLTALVDPGHRTPEGAVYLPNPKSFADERRLSGRHNPVITDVITRSGTPTRFVLQSGEGPGAGRYVFTVRSSGEMNVEVSAMPDPKKAAAFLGLVGRQVDPLKMLFAHSSDAVTRRYVHFKGNDLELVARRARMFPKCSQETAKQVE